MKMPLFLALAATAGLMPSTGAAAQSSDVLRYNLRCLAVISALYKSDDPKQREAGKVGGTYFAAKVFAIDPTIDIRAAVPREAAQIRADEVRAIGQSCGQEMMMRGRQLQGQGGPSSAAPARPARPAVPPRTEREVTVE